MQTKTLTLTERGTTPIVMMTTDIQIDYENPWIYNGKPFLSEDIGEHYGFVYCITNVLTGRRYIGRKYFWSLRKLEVSLGELKVKATGRNTTEVVTKLNSDRKQVGNEAFTRVILSLHQTKGTCNYEETKQLFINNVLGEELNGAPAFYNSNILGRYMKKDYYGKLSNESSGSNNHDDRVGR